jgi:uncharacterized membrane protein
MTALPPSPPTPPRRSWGRIALILALVLSLTGNAVTLGAWLRFREARAELLGPDAGPVRLPADLRADLRAALREDRRALVPALREIARARDAIVAAAAARPYDAAEAEIAMEAYRAAVDRLLARVQRALLARLAERQ